MLVQLKQQLQEILVDEFASLIEKKEVISTGFSARVEYPPQISMGHYSCPSALELSKIFKENPRKIAEEIKNSIIKKKIEFIEEIKIEGPGFLNFFISNSFLKKILEQNFSVEINLKKIQEKNQKNSKKINIEFVSANPTGPLNIVSARAASVGDTLCRILSSTGIHVDREYYVNDYGNQIRLLGLSIAHRYLEKLKFSLNFPEDGYQGKYVISLMEKIISAEDFNSVFKLDGLNSLNSEPAIKKYLEDSQEYFGTKGAELLLQSQKEDLKNFGVEFNQFFLESNLHKNGSVEKTFETLKKTGYLYEQDSAWFFKSTEFGDDKDRVVKRGDGRPTYLMADIAYHYDKMLRGYDEIINLWGPDHHGYIARLKGAMKALGFERKFEVLIVQQVNLLENGNPIVMSKRLGQFQTMEDLIKEIPHDAARYFFVTRSSSTHLDFDLELAKEQSNKNPVFYIEYAYARIHSIFRENQIDFEKFSIQKKDADFLMTNLNIIDDAHRKQLMLYNLRFFEEIQEISKTLDFHRLAAFLYELATQFTHFYSQKENRIKDLIENNREIANILLMISKITAETIEIGLHLMSINPPKKM